MKNRNIAILKSGYWNIATPVPAPYKWTDGRTNGTERIFPSRHGLECPPVVPGCCTGQDADGPDRPPVVVACFLSTGSDTQCGTIALSAQWKVVLSTVLLHFFPFFFIVNVYQRPMNGMNPKTARLGRLCTGFEVKEWAGNLETFLGPYWVHRNQYRLWTEIREIQ